MKTPWIIVVPGVFCVCFMPETTDTLIPSMAVFAVSMGALIGLPPSLAEIYRSDIKNVYQASGVPLAFGLVLTNISVFVHLFIMCSILYVIAPVSFDAKIPKKPGVYFGGLILLIAVSLGVASIIGLAVKDTANTSFFHSNFPAAYYAVWNHVLGRFTSRSVLTCWKTVPRYLGIC